MVIGGRLFTPEEDKDKVAKYIWFGRQMIVNVPLMVAKVFFFLFEKVCSASGQEIVIKDCIASKIWRWN